jgi:hypothetical protein
MYETKAAGRSEQPSEAFCDFVVIIAGQNASDDAHRPSPAWAEVWTTDGIDDWTEGPVWVGFAENKGASILINWVVVWLKAEVGDTQKGWNVGIVLADLSVSIFAGVAFCLECKVSPSN